MPENMMNGSHKSNAKGYDGYMKSFCTPDKCSKCKDVTCKNNSSANKSFNNQ
jgi:hypothetical protein